MSKKVYILSTLTADQIYVTWAKGGADLDRIERKVFVAGGANLAGKRLHTPKGVLTTVTEEEYTEVLLKNDGFLTHVENGFITVSNSKPSDVDEAAEGQRARDDSAPLIPADFEENKAPTTATSKTDAQPSVTTNSRRA